MTFTIGQLYAVVLGCLTFITAAGAAGAVISKAIAKARAPEDKQNEKIKALEQRIEKAESRVDEIDKLIIADRSQIGGLVESNRLLIESVYALLRHSQDGNNTAELAAASEKMRAYLFKGAIS